MLEDDKKEESSQPVQPVEIKPLPEPKPLETTIRIETHGDNSSNQETKKQSGSENDS